MTRDSTIKTIKPLKILAIILFISGILIPSAISIPKKGREHSGFIIDFNKSDLECLQSVLYYEARDQSEDGIKAVLSVVINRKNAKGFPASFCEVVKQPFQFSYLNGHDTVIKPKPKNSIDKNALEKIHYLSVQAIRGDFNPTLPPDVLFYAKHKVKKKWMLKMKLYAKIDSHSFYKEI